ncbi:MAG: 1-hydroxycarotenoid 3,4-desaturase CrtD [Bacteroidota bacterium]
MNKAIIIGSGIAGLASSLRLRAKGYDVTVFEASAYAGGKLHAFESNGYRFDYGPSLFTMPHYVDELFLLFNEDPRKHFNYVKKDSICNYFWEDGTTFSVPGDKEEFISLASKKFKEPRHHLEQYLNNSEKKYNLTAKLFLEKSLHKLTTFLSKDALKGILSSRGLDLNNSLNKVNQKYFNNPKLIQLFNRYATYNGSNPYSTPGIMSLIPQLEMRFGTYYPKGGMHEISQSLYRLALSQGINFQFSSKVDEVSYKNRKVTGVRVGSEFYASDLVVCNMDIFSAYQSILINAKKPKKVLKQERSSSAMIFYWGINKNFDELGLHNIFFSDDYQKEFDAIFHKHTLIQDPTTYINITSKEDAYHAPDGAENWFVMINSPGNKGQDWEKLKQSAKQSVIKKLSRILNTDIEKLITTEKVLDPVKIEKDTLSHEGSLYGTSSNSKFAAFLRHPNFSSSIKNLYFCGGSAHPGGGIPLCLLSAKIVSDLIPSNDTY